MEEGLIKNTSTLCQTYGVVCHHIQTFRHVKPQNLCKSIGKLRMVQYSPDFNRKCSRSSDNMSRMYDAASEICSAKYLTSLGTAGWYSSISLEKPRITLSGVLISWLMSANNFASFRIFSASLRATQSLSCSFENSRKMNLFLWTLTCTCIHKSGVSTY